MIKLEMKIYNTILTEKQQKHQHYDQVKLINVNILQVSLLNHLWEKISKNKQKQLKINKEKKLML